MGKSKKQTVDSSHYEGLMSSVRHARNRLLFFVMFAVYSFLTILSTTDKDLYLESPIKMPLLNIELPLLAFYSVMPLFLLVLYFNLLYTFRTHRDFLLSSKKKHRASLKILPLGLYEGALFNRDTFHIGLRISMRLILYILPVSVLITFWFRFADYQDLLITTWHFIAILIAMLLGFNFRGLLNQKKKLCFKRKKSFIALISLCFTAVLSMASYHYFIFYPLAKAELDLAGIEQYDERIDSLLDKGNKDRNWFIPHIALHGEILVPIDKAELEVLQSFNKDEKKDEALLLSVPSQDKQNRSFRKVILESCILLNTNFALSQFQGGNLSSAKLQGGNLESAQLQRAKLISANLQEVNLESAQLQRANLNSALLQKANLDSALLHRANLSLANLQEASLRHTKLQGAELGSARLQGADLLMAMLQGTDLTYAQLQGAELTNTFFFGANLGNASLQGATSSGAFLQGANLVFAKLQGANFTDAQFQGANLTDAQLQGADLRNAQLQGADLSYAQLQGVNFNNFKSSRFHSRKLQIPVLEQIQQKGLDRNEITEIISFLQLSISKIFFTEMHMETVKTRLYKAIDQDPVKLIREQEGINLGRLEECEFNEISRSIKNPKARKNMGLPPLDSVKNINKKIDCEKGNLEKEQKGGGATLKKEKTPISMP